MPVARYEIVYGNTAIAQLDALPEKERAQVLRKIGRLQHGLHGDIKRLHGAESAFRLRMGDYRVLFDVEGRGIIVRKIGHRREVYD
jgi:mRNA interferase RelE/StbE